MKERGVIPYADKGNVGNKKSEDITRYKIVRPDDIVVNCMNVIIGSVGLSRYTGCLSPVYYVLTRRSKRDEPRYLNAYFQRPEGALSHCVSLRASDSEVAQVSGGRSRQKESLAASPRAPGGLGCPVAQS
jgi:hypothetical protein